MLKGVVVDQSELFTTKLQQWEDFHNFDRPHGGLGGQTPYERLRQKIETSDVTGQRQSHIGSPDGVRVQGRAQPVSATSRSRIAAGVW